MIASVPTILALDFDGVICDGLIEYFQVSWQTYCQVWSSANKTPPDNIEVLFYRLRPVIETGWEMPVLIRALVTGITEVTILENWESIAKRILQEDSLQSAEISGKLDKVRDNWITKDLNNWLGLHRFYPGVIEKLKATIANIPIYIISTKEGRFVQQLLQQQGVALSKDKIFGKEAKRPKYEILRELIHQTNPSPEIWFVEDRLKTLQLVKQQPNLENIKLFLAEWGYNTAADKVIAQNDPQIRLLSLSQFSQDFSQWSHSN